MATRTAGYPDAIGGHTSTGRAGAAAMSTDQGTAMSEIAAERRRQVEIEGWSPEHDDTHSDGEMLRAAVIYYQHGARKDMPLTMREDGAPMGWPWDAEWWKPRDARRDLVRAGALCVAEKERIIRRHNQHIAMEVNLLHECTGPHTRHVDQKLRLIEAALNRLAKGASAK